MTEGRIRDVAHRRASRTAASTRSTANGGDDFLFGGAQGDTIDGGDGQNIVFGDHGAITGIESTIFNRPIGPGVTGRTTTTRSRR